MKENENITHSIGKIKEEDNALDQSVALNRIVVQLLKTKAQENKRLWVAMIISILVNLCTIAGFLWYESQWEYTTTTTTDVTQESEDAGSNILQLGDDSRIFFSSEEDCTDGQTVSEDNHNYNSQS